MSSKVPLTAILLALLLLSAANCSAGERIKVMILGNVALIRNLDRFFGGEPLVSYHAVPAWESPEIKPSDIPKMIRLYFPRTVQDMESYDAIILTQPDWPVISPKQDQWMHDAIRKGAGGLNDASVFSIVSGIAEAWSASLTSRSFPNDAPAVTAKGAGEANWMSFKVIVNRDCPEPILTVFLPFGVEDVACNGVSRMVIHREGAMVLAWQAGNFYGIDKVDYLAAWDYEEGRAMTIGDFMGGGWVKYPGDPQDNQYSPEIMMNIMFWITHRDLIADVEVFHRIKSNFRNFKSRLAVLVGLRDFIDKFGANTARIDGEMMALEDVYAEASSRYLDQEFVECENTLRDGFERFSEAEEVARKEKNTALLWVYVTEWLVSSSTLFISGFVVWTLMVRRKLYRATETTRLKREA
jgi:hypothetical protein